MNNRLKELRKHLNLIQKDFGEKIGLSGATISDIEKGKANLTDRNIALICEKYKVNEEWLRNGIGEMFQKDEQSIIDKFVKEYNLNDAIKSCLECLVKLDVDEMRVLTNYIKSVAENYNNKIHDKEKEIDPLERELELYRKELLAEQKGKTLSVSGEQKNELKNIINK